MTKEELKVMIDETINSNGVRGITGKALNLALTEIVDAMGTTSGGGDEGLKRNDVNFFDYDGTLLYAYTYEEACALTELPPLPVHDGLEVREWNYTLEDIRMQGHLGPYDSWGAYEPAGDFDFDGKTYKAYVPVGLTIEDGEYVALCDGEVSEDNLTYIGIYKDGDNWCYEDVYSFIGLILTGKADVGACVYDDGEQVQVPGVYIFERGIDEDLIYGHMDNVIVWLISIPNTVSSLYRGFMYESVVLNEIKIPVSVNSVDNVYGGAFERSRTESAIWWNGIDRYFDLSITYGISDQIADSYSNVSLGDRNATRYILGNGINYIESVYIWEPIIFDFTRHTFVPTLNSSLSINMIGFIIVPDALYDEWINATNWSSGANKIFKHSDFPWLK